MEPRFEFKLLGPLEVSVGGRTVAISAAKQRVVLASLLVEAGRVVTVDQLTGRLWGDDAPGGAQGTLRSYVMRLRRALDTTATAGPIVTCAEGYRIDLSGHVLDLQRCEALISQARTAAAEGRSERAAALLSEALGLWRGEPLSNVPSDLLQREVVPRLAEQRLLARELRIDAILTVGRHQDLIAELGELTTCHPLRERFWAQRMLALYRSGRQAEALDCYRTLSKLLTGELGIDPGPELRSLHHAILSNEPSLNPTFADQATDARRPQAPRPVTQDSELLERERELQVLDARIAAACRGTGQLVSVEGAAGVGKTRLLAAARARAQQDGMRVLVARGSELEREFAYGVVRQLFEPVVAGADKVERDDLLAGAARQCAVLFDHVDADGIGGDMSFALLHGLFWLTANLAQRPLLLIIDDLHWSDVPSLRFLAYLMPRLEGLPLLVMVALRPAEHAVDQHLIAQIITDPLATVVHPAPLSEGASAQLVRTVLAGSAEDAFCLACHTATGGNPLLLRELADAAAAEGLEATAVGVVRLHEIGPQAVKRRVALRLARLGPPAAAFCAALAVLGDRANPAHVAVLAGSSSAEALQTSRQLTDIEILHQNPPTPYEVSSTRTISFVHPLVRAAVYEGLAETARLDSHTRAAHLLAHNGEAPEHVAAHLLLVPPAGDRFVVGALRRAADQAFARGSPDSAVSYLERCLCEPPLETERADVLFQLGVAAQLLDATKAADYLASAMAAVKDPERKAAIAEILGITLFSAGRAGEASQILSQAIQALHKENSELSQRLQAALIPAALADPTQQAFVTARVNTLRSVPPDTTLGGRIRDATIAFHDMLAGTSSDTAAALARRGLDDGSLIEQTNPAAIYGCNVLIAADLDEAIPLLDGLIAVSHRRGSLFALAPAKCFRGLAWLSRGALAEAEADLRDALWVVTTTSKKAVMPVVAAYLTEVLMEQGNLDEAEMVLTAASKPGPIPRVGFWAWLLGSWARLLMLQGRIPEALQTWLACGQRFASQGGQNPAVLAWRSGAALAMHHLGRSDEAQVLMVEEITLARRWGAPSALGRALRTAGLIHDGQAGLALLREAADVLVSSPARLDHAKALIDIGTALGQSGRHSESQDHLSRGIQIAHICGATPLVERGTAELAAGGAAPRQITPSGPDALTPSERRITKLAAAGYSHRDIAQTLFITTNTVEVHLAAAYRKLGVSLNPALPL